MLFSFAGRRQRAGPSIAPQARPRSYAMTTASASMTRSPSVTPRTADPSRLEKAGDRAGVVLRAKTLRRRHHRRQKPRGGTIAVALSCRAVRRWTPSASQRIRARCGARHSRTQPAIGGHAAVVPAGRPVRQGVMQPKRRRASGPGGVPPHRRAPETAVCPTRPRRCRSVPPR